MRHYLQVLRDHKRPLRFVAGRMLVKSGLCERLTIPQNGYHLRFYPSNLSEQLWVDRSWREPELTLIRAYLRLGDKVIDVGANVGDTAITASLKVGSKGKVWAVEAHPRTYGYLLGNIKLNGVSNIEALNAAAATEPGRLLFGNDRRDDMNRVGQPGIEVDAIRLDDLIQFSGDIDLLKIDVEGYELQVLGGAPKILNRTHFVLFEVSEAHFRNFGYNLTDLLETFVKYGFTLLRATENEAVERIGPDYRTDGVENLMAVRDVEEFVRRSEWRVL